MPFPDIDPIAISLGPLAIRWYSLAYIVGLLGGLWYVSRLNRRYNFPIPDGQLESMLTHALLGVVLGGRVGFVLFYQPTYFLSHPVEIFYLWQGGMSFHGGLLGVIAALWLFARKNGVPFFRVIDLVACATPIGLGLGRIANFINGELFGRVTGVSWGIIFPHGGPMPRHPSQLYEAILEGLLLFAVLAWFAWKKDKANQQGWLSGLFLVGYGLSRFTVEFFREPDVHLGYFLEIFTMGQLLSLPMILLGIYLMHRASLTPKLPETDAEPSA